MAAPRQPLAVAGLSEFRLQTRGEHCSNLRTAFEIVGPNLLRRHDGVRRLRVGADDQRLGDGRSRQPVAIRAICRAAFWPSLPAQIMSRTAGR